MQSWLASPAVVFLSFLATIITIAQSVFIVAKWANELMHPDGEKRRMAIAVVWFCFSYVTVIAPLSWSVIMTEAARVGDTGVFAVLYPIMVNGSSLAGTLAMLTDIRAKRPFPIIACGTAAFGLACATFMYIAGTSNWAGLVVATIPSMIIGVLPLALMRSRKRPRGGTDREQRIIR